MQQQPPPAATAAAPAAAPEATAASSLSSSAPPPPPAAAATAPLSNQMPAEEAKPTPSRARAPSTVGTVKEYLAWLSSSSSGQTSYLHTKRHFIKKFGEPKWNEHKEAVRSKLIARVEKDASISSSMNLIAEPVDIYSLPPAPHETAESITIGDLHGNTVKLVYFLFRHGVIGFKKDIANPAKAYEAFVGAYEMAGEVSESHIACTRTIWTRSRDMSRHTKTLERYDELDAMPSRAEVEETEHGKIKPERVRTWLENAQKDHDIAQKMLGATREKLPPMLKIVQVFLKQIEVRRRQTLVRLIGDEVADRGSNDWLTLLVLQFLYRQKVSVIILISNHGQEFVSAYEAYVNSKEFVSKNDVVDLQKLSFIGLQLLLEDKLISMQELMHLVSSCYQPMLRALDYSLNPQGIRIYSHAPIRLEVLRYAAESLGVVYDDSTRKALAQVIDKINIMFARRVYQHSSDKCCHTSTLDNPGYMNVEERREFPLANILWNRWSAKQDHLSSRPNTVNGYQIHYVHGHDSYQSQFAHVLNLDTPCGKGSRTKRRKDTNDARQIISDLGSLPLAKVNAQRFLDSHSMYKVACSNERALPKRHHKILDIELECERVKRIENMNRLGVKPNLFQKFMLHFGL